VQAPAGTEFPEGAKCVFFRLDDLFVSAPVLKACSVPRPAGQPAKLLPATGPSQPWIWVARCSRLAESERSGIVAL